MEVKLGQKVRDKVSGFTGIATSRVEYLNGCVQYGVTPKVGKNNKVEDTRYVDEGQLEIVSKGVAVKKAKEKKDPGGYRADQPPR